MHVNDIDGQESIRINLVKLRDHELIAIYIVQPEIDIVWLRCNWILYQYEFIEKLKYVYCARVHVHVSSSPCITGSSFCAYNVY